MTINTMISTAIRGHGVPVVIRPDSAEPINTSGVFESVSVETDSDGVPSRQNSYAVTIPAADAVRIGMGDIMAIRTRRYKVKTIEGDGIHVRRFIVGAAARGQNN